jgi:4-diphosphocytidyl-2-C-methyl-D-erythritol kinase
MSVWKGIAPAKLNLFLKVVGKRPDGYHLLFTLFQTIRLADEVEISLAPGGGIHLEQTGIDVGVSPERNLAFRAAEVFFGATGGAPGCLIRLRKIIPPGTGMGGGSSDAAAVLRGLNDLTGRRLTPGDLHRIAGPLGADVPFLVAGGTAIGRGVGDELTPLHGLSKGWIVVVIPGTPLATAAVYAGGTFALTENGLEVTIPTSARDLLSMARRLGNDLAEPAERLAPHLALALADIAALKPDVGGMTGSGSALFAWFSRKGDAERAAVVLAEHGRIVVTEPLTKEEFDASCSVT